MGEIERRALPLDLIELRQDGDSPRSVSWYPALFDTLSVDLGGFRERISRRAFTETLKAHDIPALINHDRTQILGRTSKGSLKLSVDLRGLQALTSIPDTTYARDLIANLENGNINGGSFAFLPTRDSWKMENVEGEQEPVLVRTVHEARLFDVSLVTMPAYPATEDSASLRSLADEWRAKLTEPAPVVPPVPAIAPDLSRYRRQLDLIKRRWHTCQL